MEEDKLSLAYLYQLLSLKINPEVFFKHFRETNYDRIILEDVINNNESKANVDQKYVVDIILENLEEDGGRILIWT